MASPWVVWWRVQWCCTAVWWRCQKMPCRCLPFAAVHPTCRPANCATCTITPTLLSKWNFLQYVNNLPLSGSPETILICDAIWIHRKCASNCEFHYVLSWQGCLCLGKCAQYKTASSAVVAAKHLWCTNEVYILWINETTFPRRTLMLYDTTLEAIKWQICPYNIAVVNSQNIWRRRSYIMFIHAHFLQKVTNVICLLIAFRPEPMLPHYKPVTLMSITISPIPLFTKVR